METEIGGTERDNKLESESDVLRFRNLLEGIYILYYLFEFCCWCAQAAEVL